MVNEKVLLLNKRGNKLFIEEYINPFWNDVFMEIKILVDKIIFKCAKDNYSVPLFCNNNIIVEAKTIYFPDWIEKGE